MKKIIENLRDTFIAGLIFLLPLLVLFVLLTKVFQFLTGFTGKIAAWFGLKSFIGISGGTIVGAISVIILCIFCGYLVRIAFFKAASKWLDKKLAASIPGYSVYREMAMSKLDEKEEALPYETAVWVTLDDMQQPGFLIEKMPDGRLVIFIPTAGNPKEGSVFTMAPGKVQQCPDIDMKQLKMAISNIGIGLSKL